VVDIFRQLEMITFNIIAHDGTLFSTRARYKGCTCFSGQCEKIVAFGVMDESVSQNQINTAILLGVKEQLDKQGLCLEIIRLKIFVGEKIIDLTKQIRATMTATALRERGYDRNGWPYAPCDIPSRPNGFDGDGQLLTFCCMKQCRNLKAPGIRNLDKTYNIGSCEHLNKTCGYTTH
jgi:hypothetical protein